MDTEARDGKSEGHSKHIRASSQHEHWRNQILASTLWEVLTVVAFLFSSQFNKGFLKDWQHGQRLSEAAVIDFMRQVEGRRYCWVFPEQFRCTQALVTFNQLYKVSYSFWQRPVITWPDFDSLLQVLPPCLPPIELSKNPQWLHHHDFPTLPWLPTIGHTRTLLCTKRRNPDLRVSRYNILQMTLQQSHHFSANISSD